MKKTIIKKNLIMMMIKMIKKDVTWKTVSKALVMESKLEVGLPSGKLKWPPKSWRR